MSWLVRLMVFGFVATACSSSTKRSAPAGEPADAVRRFFDAVERRDCEALSAAVGGSQKAKLDSDGCDETLEQLEHDELVLVDVVETTPDGREPDTYIVTIRVAAHGHEKQFRSRVERIGDAWVLVVL